MSGVLHDWECMAHGVFEARAKVGTTPNCPKGCSRSLVQLVHLHAPGTVSAKTRKGDRLVREMADMQGLSDISTSPSRPGGSVAQRNRAKQQLGRLVGPKGREYPEMVKGAKVDFGTYIGAMTNKSNELTNTGFGHKYEPAEWKKREDGVPVHVGAQGPLSIVPTGTTGVSVERVKERT